MPGGNQTQFGVAVAYEALGERRAAFVANEHQGKSRGRRWGRPGDPVVDTGDSIMAKKRDWGGIVRTITRNVEHLGVCSHPVPELNRRGRRPPGNLTMGGMENGGS